ncbi:FAD-binding oxidoreductase [Sphingomonas colocasiae]|uniref:FAD-binding oxidoreductase n=2 Tax=Sphingomonas colocasiae TaxID=1848973 RepID=A0ABS7PU61_9SPHN|nr:FAD-binding oxidoreductase [Sphingomonas colocasiae]MBY8823937.1 FAD-binding oxidoreductase [Sphingomonas colocasiae]
MAPGDRKRILVIGGGIAGVSLAYELACSHRVTVVEAEAVLGYHATGRSAAMYVANYGNAAIRALTRASRGFLCVPPAGFCETPILRPRETLYIANEAQADALAREEYAALDLLSVEQVLARVPMLRPSAVVAGGLDRDSAEIEVDLLHQCYARAARARGAALSLGARVEAAAWAGASWSVRTSAGIVEADIVVNAAGAWADRIARLFGAAPAGLVPMRRTAVLIDPPAGLDLDTLPMVMTAKEDLYFKPDAGLLMVSPADETPVEPCDVQAEEWDVAVAIDRLQQHCDIDVRHVRHRWAGLRTFAPDRSPVVGHDDALPGFFWFAGQGGYGIQIAPALARLGAMLIDGRAGNADADHALPLIADFPPRRSSDSRG